MPTYFALLVPSGLALFAAISEIAWVVIERRQARHQPAAERSQKTAVA
jgi:hypothetical protein